MWRILRIVILLGAFSNGIISQSHSLLTDSSNKLPNRYFVTENPVYSIIIGFGVGIFISLMFMLFSLNISKWTRPNWTIYPFSISHGPLVAMHFTALMGVCSGGGYWIGSLVSEHSILGVGPFLLSFGIALYVGVQIGIKYFSDRICDT